MDLPDLKALKKLADACRKVGIKHYKSEKFEFTLSDEAPVSEYKKNKANKNISASDNSTSFQSDSLTDEELLFWSVGGGKEFSGLTDGND